MELFYPMGNKTSYCYPVFYIITGPVFGEHKIELLPRHYNFRHVYLPRDQKGHQPLDFT